MSKWQVVVDAINIYNKDSEKYRKRKESNPKSFYCGIISIVYAIVGVMLGFGAIYGTMWLFDNVDSSGQFFISIATVFGAIIVGIFGTVMFLFFLIRAFVASIFQINMEGKALGIVALLFTILLLSGCIALAVILLI